MPRRAVIFATVLLSGCAAHYAEQEHAQCLDFGYRSGTPEYSACRRFLYAEREQRRRAMALVGFSLMQQSSVPAGGANVPTSYVIDGHFINCNRFGGTVTCNGLD